MKIETLIRDKAQAEALVGSTLYAITNENTVTTLVVSGLGTPKHLGFRDKSWFLLDPSGARTSLPLFTTHLEALTHLRDRLLGVRQNALAEASEATRVADEALTALKALDYCEVSQ